MLLSVASSKEKMINVRLTPSVHDQFKIACDLRGVSMSSLLHQFIVRTIREERALEPEAFDSEGALKPIAAKTRRMHPDTERQPPTPHKNEKKRKIH